MLVPPTPESSISLSACKQACAEGLRRKAACSLKGEPQKQRNSFAKWQTAFFISLSAGKQACAEGLRRKAACSLKGEPQKQRNSFAKWQTAFFISLSAGKQACAEGNEKTRLLSLPGFSVFGGEGGIRTPGTSQFNGFQDRRNRPLCHLSVCLGMQRYVFFPSVQKKARLPQRKSVKHQKFNQLQNSIDIAIGLIIKCLTLFL